MTLAELFPFLTVGTQDALLPPPLVLVLEIAGDIRYHFTTDFECHSCIFYRFILEIVLNMSEILVFYIHQLGRFTKFLLDMCIVYSDGPTQPFFTAALVTKCSLTSGTPISLHIEVTSSPSPGQPLALLSSYVNLP